MSKFRNFIYGKPNAESIRKLKEHARKLLKEGELSDKALREWSNVIREYEK